MTLMVENLERITKSHKKNMTSKVKEENSMNSKGNEVRKIADLGGYPVEEVIGEDGERVDAVGVGIVIDAVLATASSLQSPLQEIEIY
ncbi:hypothetical protein LWI29_032551 [Acer saccharum]|uniref:Uncharacterized protein n=1 Tax=Acer saccharum TaxID=4024 RepID=A0AA39S5W1_ACESA|nr:hypothetical protein LWI29_032551 [Acer saccharum]